MKLKKSTPPFSSQTTPRWTACADIAALNQAASQRILQVAAEAIDERGEFLFVLAGGGTPQPIYQRLIKAKTDWSKWKLYYGDERCVPVDHAERNSMAAEDSFIRQVEIPAANIFPMPAELGPVAGAAAYAATLRTVPAFDLTLLGIGEDGHTASLFPNQPWGREPSAPDTLAVFDSPKPPPARVSMSAARLSRSRHVMFAIAGESKRTAVQKWRGGDAIAAASIHALASLEVLIEQKLLA